jgi:hypothetical protein
MRPYDTHIFYPSIDKHLRDAIPEIESWIVVNQALIAHSIDQAYGLRRGRQSLITLHFSVLCSGLFWPFYPLWLFCRFSPAGSNLFLRRPIALVPSLELIFPFAPSFLRVLRHMAATGSPLLGSLEPRKKRNDLF